MAVPTLNPRELADGYAPEQEQPLGGYAVLTATFAGAVTLFAGWLRRSGRELPESIAPGDLALITVATHKASRMITKDRVTSAVRAPFTELEGRGGPAEVEEHARGRGLRRAVGELLICPYCLSMWIAAAFAAGLIVAPRATRWVASTFAVQFGSDVLQVTYKQLADTL
jgi:hypothetical protein